MNSKHYYSLHDIVSIVSQTFSELFSEHEFWFVAEVAKIVSVKDRLYIDFVEYDEHRAIIAKARGVIRKKDVYLSFLKKTNIDNVGQIQGMQILCKGYLGFHEEYGFSISISDVSSEYTIGKMKQNIQDTKQQLMQLGIFSANKEKKFGLPPYTIAIISSEKSQGLFDFMSVLGESKYAFSYRYYYCSIHGNDARIQVYEQLQLIYKDIQAGEKIDAVILVRGGGGSTGIIWQNDLDIAKGICYMQVPVVLAIGHTQDVSLLDEIVYISAKTPTDAAYTFVDLVQKYEVDIDAMRNDICLYMSKFMERKEILLDDIYNSIMLTIPSLYIYLENEVEKYFSSIMQYEPLHMLRYGYGLIKHHIDNRYLNREEIYALKAGDKVILSIYDKEILITIS